jgi:hypothetical protein
MSPLSPHTRIKNVHSFLMKYENLGGQICKFFTFFPFLYHSNIKFLFVLINSAAFCFAGVCSRGVRDSAEHN